MTFGERFLTQPTSSPPAERGAVGCREGRHPLRRQRLRLRRLERDPGGRRARALRRAVLAARRDCTAAGGDQRLSRGGLGFHRGRKDLGVRFRPRLCPGGGDVRGFHFVGRLDWQPQLRAALWTSEESRLVSHSIFENVLRVVVAYHALERAACCSTVPPSSTMAKLGCSSGRREPASRPFRGSPCPPGTRSSATT